jgi:hypothetical protein
MMKKIPISIGALRVLRFCTYLRSQCYQVKSLPSLIPVFHSVLQRRVGGYVGTLRHHA